MVQFDDEYNVEKIDAVLTKYKDPTQIFKELLDILKPEQPAYQVFIKTYRKGITASELLRNMYLKPEAKPAKPNKKLESVSPVVKAVKLRTIPIAPQTTSINKPGWLPDWRNADEYSHLTMQSTHSFKGATKTRENIKPGTIKTIKTPTSKAAFAWEFLRRNSEYQADYERLASMAEKHGVIGRYERAHGLNANSCWPDAAIQDETDYGIDIELSGSAERPHSLSLHADLYRSLTKWGLDNYLPNPCYDLHDMPELNVLFRAGRNVYPVEQFFEDNGEQIPYDGGIVATDKQIWWLFDTSLPLAPQLEDVKQMIENTQQLEYGRALSKSKTSSDDYIRYLRLLDAVAVNASNDEIGNVLYNHIDSGIDYTDKSQTNKRINTISNEKKAANKLIQEGYRSIF